VSHFPEQKSGRFFEVDPSQYERDLSAIEGALTSPAYRRFWPGGEPAILSPQAEVIGEMAIFPTEREMRFMVRIPEGAEPGFVFARINSLDLSDDRVELVDIESVKVAGDLLYKIAREMRDKVVKPILVASFIQDPDREETLVCLTFLNGLKPEAVLRYLFAASVDSFWNLTFGEDFIDPRNVDNQPDGV
jgi:hypothetical protein